MKPIYTYSLRVEIPRAELGRLELMKLVEPDTDEATLIISNSRAQLEYWYYDRKKDGTRHQRRTMGFVVFDEHGVKGEARVAEILGESNPFLTFGAQQLWPRK